MTLFGYLMSKIQLIPLYSVNSAPRCNSMKKIDIINDNKNTHQFLHFWYQKVALVRTIREYIKIVTYATSELLPYRLKSIAQLKRNSVNPCYLVWVDRQILSNYRVFNVTYSMRKRARREKFMRLHNLKLFIEKSVRFW